MEKRKSLQQMVLGKLEIHMQQNETKPYLSPCTKINSQWIKDLEIRPETLHLIEEKVGPNLQHVGLGSDFLNGTPIAQEIKARINNWDRFKLNSFLSAKETISNAESLQSGRISLPLILQIERKFPESIKNSKNPSPRIQIIQLTNGLRK